MSVEATDKESAAVATAPRVSLEDIKCAIKHQYHLTGDEALMGLDYTRAGELKLLSICIIVMQNGFVIIGKSAPASPENFNRELGKKFAYEDAIRQLWPLMGFSLRDKLASAAQT